MVGHEVEHGAGICAVAHEGPQESEAPRTMLARIAPPEKMIEFFGFMSFGCPTSGP